VIDVPATLAITDTDPAFVDRNTVKMLPAASVVPEAGVNVTPCVLAEKLTATLRTGFPNASRNVSVRVTFVPATTVSELSVIVDCVALAGPEVIENVELVELNSPELAVSWKFDPTLVTETPENVARPWTAATVLVPVSVAPPLTDSVT
jgi:hypothetical protein